MTKLMIYVNQAYVQLELIEGTSGHVQLPILLCEHLSRLGHDVSLVTARPSPGQSLPKLNTEPQIILLSPPNESRGPRILGILVHIFQLYRAICRERYDRIYFFGAKRVGLLLGLLTLLGVPSDTILVLIKYPLSPRIMRFFEQSLLHRINHIFVTSNHLETQLQQMGLLSSRVIRPGILKKIKYQNIQADITDFPRDSVLFWRNADWKNGVDIALNVYQRLAPNKPNVDFIFAVRTRGDDEYKSQILKLAETYDNVYAYIFPYTEGINFENILKSASLALFPMRELSMHPQMAILETMYAGVPVITTEIECNPELVISGVTGVIIPPGDIEKAKEAVELLLGDEQLRNRMRDNALAFVIENYNNSTFLDSLVTTL